ncbi:alpha-galactosidase [Kutzneria sp. CA-103260]|uniref:alpha-galactosidase n=1 Tax=Kutzneria sp. CA-103260 TaxID=2802641 RepID=UPI001BA5240D|nr:alpha-galactosidase [Kutzneria sp. CA-103260]QUQ67394.1 Alpha galactosidase A [Kutzneria sp. CA-103260]
MRNRVLTAALAGLLTITGLAVTAPTAAADSSPTVRPPLGWSSWSFVRKNPTAATIQAQAKAMKDSGLTRLGYQYVNIDDFWYQCPGAQGPNVDQYGRWVIDSTKFPAQGAKNGIQATADYVHSLGLKFGLYATPGIAKQAVAQNTAIEGTPYHAADIATSSSEANYNCGGMVGIDYSKPGAQAFLDSWAKQFASWGVDYLKLDGVGTQDAQDVQGWSTALKNSGRQIHLELSNSLDINNAKLWQDTADGWRTGGDVECYCGPNDSSYPLTTWASVASRFDQVAAWAPYGGPKGFNDYDSLEVGNGANDGLTPDERKTQMSLWSLAASPLFLGTDLTHLDPTDLSLLRNADVLAVDQDAIDAKRISSDANTQVFAKTETNGDVIVGLFNTATAPRAVSTTAAALGLPKAADYSLQDLWNHSTTESTGAISTDVPAHGVALYRVKALRHADLGVKPNTSVSLTWDPAPSDSLKRTGVLEFVDNGSTPLRDVSLALQASSGATVSPANAPSQPVVWPGGKIRVPFTVTISPSDKLFTTSSVSASADFRYLLGGSAKQAAADSTTVNHPVTGPYQTFASTTAQFSQVGDRLGIQAQGADLWNTTNEYGSMYLPGKEHDGSETVVRIDSQDNSNVWAKAGIMVRNDIGDANGGKGFVILAETPGNGFLLDWDSDGDGLLDQQASVASAVYPAWLKLVRSGTTFSGYYSVDGTNWTLVGTGTVPSAAATQDVGVYAISHAPGTTAEVDFDAFTTS